MPVVVAIAGVPGAGKTTLAAGLVGILGYDYLSTGDIARRVDGGSVADGGMADEQLFRVAFEEALRALTRPTIIDGLPRSEDQIPLLPAGALIVGLNCTEEVSTRRLLGRGRSDDVPDVVARRLREQRALLAVDDPSGWFYERIGWGRVMSTSLKSPAQVLAGVLGFLRGEHAEVF